MLIIDRWTWIPRGAIVREDTLRHRLTVPNGSSPGTYFACFEEAPGYLGVPRALDPRPWLRGPMSAIVSAPARGVILGTHTPVLGPHDRTKYDQGPAWAGLSTAWTWPYGRQFVLKCGGGKTVLALRFAQARQTRTLVVVHNTTLMEQWADTALAPWGLGMAPEQVGFLGDKRRPKGNELLVVALMHMVALQDIEPAFCARFGLVIYDEGDLFGASKLSRALPRFAGERLLVTATPERRDGNHELYKLHVGPECFRDLGVDLKPKVTFLRTGLRRRGPVHGRWGMALVNAVARNEKRPELVRRVIEEMLRRGRHVLVLCERRRDALGHYEALREHFPAALAIGKSRKPRKGNADKPLSPTEQRERRAHELSLDPGDDFSPYRVVVATSNLAGRGLDHPRFDGVVVEYVNTRNTNWWQQALGRAARSHSAKTSAEAVVLVDHEPDMLESYEIVRGWCLQQKFPVEDWKV